MKCLDERVTLVLMTTDREAVSLIGELSHVFKLVDKQSIDHTKRYPYLTKLLRILRHRKNIGCRDWEY